MELLVFVNFVAFQDIPSRKTFPSAEGAEYGDLVEGDVKLPKATGPSGRWALTEDNPFDAKRWEDGVVPYVFEDDFERFGKSR